MGRRGCLVFRDSILTLMYVLFLAVIVSAPLAVALYEDVIPSNYEVSGKFTIYRNINEFKCVPLPVNVSYFSSSLFWRSYGEFLKHVSIMVFLVSGFIAAYTLGRPLELKYFFIELTFVGSRLRLLVARLVHALLPMVVASFSSALVLSSIIYVAWPGFSFGSAYALSLCTIASASVSGFLASSLLVLMLKNTAASIVSLLGFSGLIVLLSAKIEPLVVVLFPSVILRETSLAPLLLLYFAIIITLIVVRGVNLEY